jgi:hypothetical protein
MFVVLLRMAYDVPDKVKKKYGSLGHSVLAVQLERGRQGLGLSLAGHKDRSRMAVFVCGLNPNGAASRSGGIQVGDEILEVTNFVPFFPLHSRAGYKLHALEHGQPQLRPLFIWVSNLVCYIKEETSLNRWISGSHSSDYEAYVFWDVRPYSLVKIHRHAAFIFRVEE